MLGKKIKESSMTMEEIYEAIIKNEQYLKQISKKVNVDDAEKIKSIVQDFLSLNKPTSEIMKVIINRIEIHQDKQVDLYFNFKQLNNLKEKAQG